MKNSLLLIFLFSTLFINKTGAVVYNNPDKTIKTSYIEDQSDSVVPLPFSIYLNFYTGVYTNKTFGTHPILSIPLGILYKNNYFNIDYEKRFGNSKNSYNILDNDTLKSTRSYGGQFIGLGYERKIIKGAYNEVVLHTGLGYDWNDVFKNSTIKESRSLGGFSFNLGLGYTFFFKKKHGPNLMFIYYHTNYQNPGGTVINSNGYSLRVTYAFGRVY